MPQRRVGGTAALACWSPCVLKKSLADCPDISILKTLLHPRRNEQAAYRWPPRAVGRIPRMVCDLSTSVDNASVRRAMHGVPACVWGGARQARAPHLGARPMRPACPAAPHAHAKRTGKACNVVRVPRPRPRTRMRSAPIRNTPPVMRALACPQPPQSQITPHRTLRYRTCDVTKPQLAERHLSKTATVTNSRDYGPHPSAERSLFGQADPQNSSWQKTSCPKLLQSRILGVPTLPSVAFLDRWPCKTAVGGERLVRKRYVRGVGVCDGCWGRNECRLLGGNQLEHALIRIAHGRGAYHGRGANHGRGVYRSGRGHNRMPSLPFTCEFTLSPESALRRPTPLV